MQHLVVLGFYLHVNATMERGSPIGQRFHLRINEGSQSTDRSHRLQYSQNYSIFTLHQPDRAVFKTRPPLSKVAEQGLEVLW